MTKFVPVIWDIETTGLNPMAEYWWSDEMEAQVISVGFATIPNWDSVSHVDEADINVYVYSDHDEYNLLDLVVERIFSKVSNDYLGKVVETYSKVVGTEYAQRASVNIQPFFVGFNSRSFDHTYMGARFSRKRLNGWPITHGWKRLDMQRVAGNHRKLDNYPDQESYAEFHGVDVEDEFDGSDMPQFFKDNNMPAIRSHCEADVEELAKIFMLDREMAMEEFYSHYDIDREPNFVEEADI